MFLTKQELEQEPYARRIIQLQEFCREQNHTSIPKLLEEAAAFGGIREDVLEYFEKNRELGINREMFVAFLCFLTSGERAHAQWYELISQLAAQKEKGVQGHFFHEVTEAFRSDVPYETAAHALECKTVYEFQCYHQNDTDQRKERQKKQQNKEREGRMKAKKHEAPEGSLELQKKIFNLENDIRYYKRLYQELHFEMDRTAMSLMKARRENRLLKEELETYAHKPCEEKGNTKMEGVMPEAEDLDKQEYPAGNETFQEIQEPAQEELKEETVSHVFWDTWNPEDALLPDVESVEGESVGIITELSAIMAESESEADKSGLETEETMPEVEELVSIEETCMSEEKEAAPDEREVVPETNEIQRDTKRKDARIEKRTPVQLFVEIVQTIRLKRFLKKKEADRRRELVNLMNRNGYGPERQKLVLSAMNQEGVPIETIWGMVYQGFTVEQLRDGLYTGLPESMTAV